MHGLVRAGALSGADLHRYERETQSRDASSVFALLLIPAVYQLNNEAGLDAHS